MKVNNPYSLEVTLSKLRDYLTQIHHADAVALLNKATSKAAEDSEYAAQLEAAMLRGSTIEGRELFSAFGDFIAPPRAEFPFYPHADAVNSIDSALLHIKLGCEQEAIQFYNGLHNSSR